MIFDDLNWHLCGDIVLVYWYVDFCYILLKRRPKCGQYGADGLELMFLISVHYMNVKWLIISDIFLRGI